MEHYQALHLPDVGELVATLMQVRGDTGLGFGIFVEPFI